MRRTSGATGSSRPYSNENSRRKGMSTAMTRRLHEIARPPGGVGAGGWNHTKPPEKSPAAGEKEGKKIAARRRQPPISICNQRLAHCVETLLGRPAGEF